MSAPSATRFDVKCDDMVDYLAQVQEALLDLLVDAGTQAQRADLNEALRYVRAAKTSVYKARR